MNESIQNLCISLNLPKPHIYCQDWEDEVSDSQRIGEFIQFYQQNNLTDEEKYLLMIIIINSFDDALNEGLNFSDKAAQHMEEGSACP